MIPGQPLFLGEWSGDSGSGSLAVNDANGTHVNRNPMTRSAAGDDKKPAGFAQREGARLGRKRARYEEVALERAAFARKNQYYGQQVRRLVESMVMPGSRVLEVGCGLGDLIGDLDASHV